MILPIISAVLLLFLFFLSPNLVFAQEQIGTFPIYDDIVPSGQSGDFVVSGGDIVPSAQVGTFPIDNSDIVPQEQIGTFPISSPQVPVVFSPPPPSPMVVNIPSPPSPNMAFNPNVSTSINNNPNIDISNNLQQSQNQSQSQSQNAYGGNAWSNSSTGPISVNVSGGSGSPSYTQPVYVQPVAQPQPVIYYQTAVPSQPVVYQRTVPTETAPIVVQAAAPVQTTPTQVVPTPIQSGPTKTPVRAVQTVPQVEALPKTGPPLAAFSLAGLIPLGWKLKKFGLGHVDQGNIGQMLWQQRQFFK